MSYSDAKENIIKQIQDDPAGFLVEQLGDRQPFSNQMLTVFDVEENPTIMRLRGGDHIQLTVHSWKTEFKKLKRVDMFFRTQPVEEWGEAAWEQMRILSCIPKDSDGPYSVREQNLHGTAVEFFRWIMQEAINKNDTLDCVWLFPFGARRSQDIPTLTMCATNKDKYRWQTGA